MTNAANFFAAFEACLPAAYEVSCRIRTGSPTSFWLDSPRTVASRRSIGSPVPRRRGLGRQAATRRRHGGVYEFREGCQSSASVTPPKTTNAAIARGVRVHGKTSNRYFTGAAVPAVPKASALANVL